MIQFFYVLAFAPTRYINRPKICPIVIRKAKEVTRVKCYFGKLWSRNGLMLEYLAIAFTNRTAISIIYTILRASSSKAVSITTQTIQSTSTNIYPRMYIWKMPHLSRTSRPSFILVVFTVTIMSSTAIICHSTGNTELSRSLVSYTHCTETNHIIRTLIRNSASSIKK